MFTAYLEGWEGEVKGVEEIRLHIYEQLSALMRKFNRHLSNSLKATIKLEDGTELEVPITVSLSGSYNPEVTELSFKVAMGEEIPIKFGSTLHNTLYRASCGKRVGNIRSATTLRNLKLIEEWGAAATAEGMEVLLKLNELGPPENKRGRILVARELLDAPYGKETATRGYLIRRNFIQYNNQTYHHELTDKGIQWLEGNAHRVYNYKLPPSFDTPSLIHFMSREQLAAPLADADFTIRDAARERMKELGGEVEEEEEITIDPEMIKRLWVGDRWIRS